MSSLTWTKFATIIYRLAWPPRIARAIASSTATSLEKTRERLSPYASLQRCSVRLEHIRATIEGISPERRRKIQTAAERGACRYLSDIELELGSIVSLYDRYYGLCMVYEDFSFFQRHIPGTHFHKELLSFEDLAKRFLKDAWKTTAPGDRTINWAMIFDMNSDIDHKLDNLAP